MGEIKVIKMEVGKPLEIVNIEHSLENMQKMVGGLLSVVKLPYDIDLWVNDEGLLQGLEQNFMIFAVVNGELGYAETIVGNTFFASSSNNGETIGLTDDQIDKIRYMFRHGRHACLLES